MISAAIDNPLRALRPAAALVRNSTTDASASSICPWLTGSGKLATISCSCSQPSPAERTSSSNSLRTAKYDSGDHAAEHYDDPEERVAVASAGDQPQRRSTPTTGLTAAAKIRAIKKGMTSSRSCSSP